MKVLRTSTTILRSTTGKLLKIRPDDYVEPLPNVGMIQIQVEDNETVTLPTPDLNSTALQYSYIDLYMYMYDTPGGTILQEDDNSGNNNQPRIIASNLLANTEYYIKIIGKRITTYGQFNITVTGNGTAVPTPETGITSMIVGTTVKDQYLDEGDMLWYKFKTTNAGSYTIITSKGTFDAYNYQVDWNDGYSSPTITTWNSPDATHVYAHKGTYTLYITGTLPVWSVQNQAAGTGNIRLLITKVISWGEIGLKKIDFNGCTALAALPEQTAKLTQVLSFANFCAGCTSLVGIPYGTFFGNVDMPVLRADSFASAFYNCQSIRTIHSTTFRDCGNSRSFAATFANCIRMEFLPDLLFENCYKVTTWFNCFGNCNLITYIPGNLFYRAMMDVDYSLVVNSDMGSCFAQWSSLTTIPAELFSSQTLDNTGLNKVKGTGFVGTFSFCTTINNLPTHIFHNQIYATDFAGVFYGCSTLTATPASCFEGCITTTNMGQYQRYTQMGTTYQYTYGVFGGCANLVEVGADCFKECSAVTSYECVFYNDQKLARLCDNIFDNSPLVTNFGYSFTNNRLLSSWDSDPEPTNYQLDPEIFKYNTLVTSFFYTFSGCYKFIDLPEILFSTCSEVTNFVSTFENCTGVTAIPPKLFRYNPKVLYFSSTFSGCIGITKIPIITENLVDYGVFYFNPLVKVFYRTFYGCRLADDGDIKAIPAITFLGNTEVSTNYVSNYYTGSFNGTFQGNTTLQSIPDQLFINCTKATDFSYTFAGCTNINLTSVPANLFVGNQNADLFVYTFQNVPLTSVPATLFESCIRVSSFSYCFSGTKLTTVPATIFSYAAGAVQNFSYTFQSCILFTDIPIDLFRYNVNVQTFSNCFQGCVILPSIPDDIFRYNIIAADFTSVFQNCYLLVNPGTNIFKYAVGAITFTSAFDECRKLELNSYMFYGEGEQPTRFLNKAVIFTNCFKRTLWNGNLDLYMGYSLTYNGTIITSDDNTAGNQQPQLTRSLLANTNYYIKITVVGGVDAGLFDIIVTGGTGPGVPDPETGCTLLYVGTSLTGETITGIEEKWYKFKTTTAGSYVFKTTLNATEIPLRWSTAPDLWNCTYNFNPTITTCFGGAGNNAISLSNYNDIPLAWR